MDISEKSTTQSTPAAAFPFESKFLEVEGHRVHYIEEGRGDPILFIHGNPTSSYLWRNILPRVARETGRRGIALDLLGFGRSDKPDIDYTLRIHEQIVTGFIEKRELRNLVLVLHDWGGPLGAHYAVNHRENVKGIAFMETFLWNLTWDDLSSYKTGFKLFRSPVGYLMNQVMNFFVNTLLPGAVLNKANMTEEVMQHYREPFPTTGSRKAVRIFPQLVPIDYEPAPSLDFIEEIEHKLPAVTSPILWLKAHPGVIVTENTSYHLVMLKEKLPQLVVKDFGPGLHYIQEDDPERVAGMLVEWIREAVGKGVYPKAA